MTPQMLWAAFFASEMEGFVPGGPKPDQIDLDDPVGSHFIRFQPIIAWLFVCAVLSIYPNLEDWFSCWEPIAMI